MTTSEEAPAQTGERRSPGRELGAARERAGIERSDMAQTLHLPERQLDALERDDYARLPPPAFVRGYLRAYAREMGLDADDIVAAYEALGAAAEDPEIRVATAAEGRSTGHGALVGLAIVLLVVVAGVAGWWWQGRPAPTASTEPGTEQAAAETAGDAGADASADTGADTGADGSGDTAADAGSATGDAGASAEPAPDAASDESGTDATAEAAPTAGRVDGADETGTTASAEASAQSGEPADTAETTLAQADAGESSGEAAQAGTTAEPATDQADPATGAEAAAAESGADEDAPAAEETSAAETGATTASASATGDAAVADGGEAVSADGAGSAADDAGDGETAGYEPPDITASAERATAPAAEEGPDAIVLEVDGRSWIEVTDAEGRELVYTLYTGSAPLQLRGYAPFDVFLGNSPAVTIRVGDEVVSKDVYTRSNNTARFLVDEDGARRP